MKTKRIALLTLLGTLLGTTPTAFAGHRSPPSAAGTWYLALDTTPFHLPGLALSGLATFHRDGTVMILDAGDFGQATFLNKQHSAQLGAWEYVRDKNSRHCARQITATTLYLEADLNGEVEAWYRVELHLTISNDGQELTGTVSTFKLACDNAPPIPTPLTCPDPIENADLFIVDGPTDVPVTLRRLNAKS